MKIRVYRALGVVLIVFVLLLAAGIFRRTSSPRPPPPHPNGYDDILHAAKIATGDLRDFTDLDHEALRGLVQTNGEALRALRVGLTRRSFMPQDLQGSPVRLQSLFYLLGAEARLAELDNRLPDAVRSYVDFIRLGPEVSRGGVIIDRLVGDAFEDCGRRPLVKLLPKLSCEQIRPLVGELEQINTNETPWEDIQQNENRFTISEIFRYREYLNPVSLVSTLWKVPSVNTAVREQHSVSVARLRLLTVELALRVYSADQGGPPRELEMLVPKYLHTTVLDPFSQRPLVYRSRGTNWLLYSVGPDRVDDGGKSVGRVNMTDPTSTANKGDLLYDSP